MEAAVVCCTPASIALGLNGQTICAIRLDVKNRARSVIRDDHMTIQRTALITGAASGIGLAIARCLAANGMHVMLADRSEQVHEVTRSLCSNGGRAIAHLSDLGQPEQVLDLANAAKTALGHVDIMVNNAGVHPKNEGRPFRLPEITTPDWETVLR